MVGMVHFRDEGYRAGEQRRDVSDSSRDDKTQNNL